jgi:hypothetical protein
VEPTRSVNTIVIGWAESNLGDAVGAMAIDRRSAT